MAHRDMRYTLGHPAGEGQGGVELGESAWPGEPGPQPLPI